MNGTPTYPPRRSWRVIWGFPSRQPGNLIPIPPDHGFLLFSSPTLDLSFTFQCLSPRPEFLQENQFDRSPLGGITPRFAAVMLSDSSLEIISVPGVIGAVSTTEDVYVKAHYFL